MAGLLDQFAKAVLFQFDPERAHRMAIRALAAGLVAAAPPPPAALRTRVLDLDLPSPIGLAAGFDKNAEAVNGLLRLGFGFIEIGTVTPRPQPGNPKPRMFRLETERAIINRLGFNNAGIETVRDRLFAAAPRGVVGVNIGVNKDSEDRIADYVAGIEAFAPLAAYLTINVSSPNTPGLRDFQSAASLVQVLERCVAARDEATNSERATPLFLKVAPDLTEDDVGRIAEAVLSRGIDGMIVSNTTLSRDGLTPSRHSGESGGLSGRPLFRRSTALLARFRQALGPDITLIGSGGVDSAKTAWTKLAAGADLVQVYTGFIYEGQRIAADINAGLAQMLRDKGLTSIADVVGTETERWAPEPI